MNTESSIPVTTVYADEAPGGYVTPPTSAQFHAGVEPEMTCPAPWWNYFTKLFTETNIRAKADITAMLTELNNALTAFGITPDAESSTQLQTLLTQGIISRTFAAVGGTNPFEAGTPLTPYNVGDVVINTTSLEVWQGITKVGATSDWILLVGDKKTVEVNSPSYTVGKDVEEIVVTTAASDVNIIIPAGLPTHRKLRISRAVASTKRITVSPRGGEMLPMTPLLPTRDVQRDYQGICTDPFGNMWATVYGNTGSVGVYKAPAGSTTFALVNSRTLCTAICSDPSGNIWVCVIGGGSIYKSIAGSSTFTSTGAVGSSDWSGICSDPAGNIYAITGTGKVYKCLAGSTTFTLMTDIADNAKSIASDSQGNLFISTISSKLYKCTVGNTSFVVLIASVYASGYNIFFDASDTLWGMSTTNSRLTKWRDGEANFTQVGSTMIVDVSSGGDEDGYLGCFDLSGRMWVISTLQNIYIGGNQGFETHGVTVAAFENNETIVLDKVTSTRWAWREGVVYAEYGAGKYYRNPDGIHTAIFNVVTPPAVSNSVTTATRLNVSKILEIFGSFITANSSFRIPFGYVSTTASNVYNLITVEHTRTGFALTSSASLTSNYFSQEAKVVLKYTD